MKIAHLTTVHPRHDTRVYFKECRSVAAAGFETHLIVGDGLGPESRDGVQIHDVGARPASRLMRMLVQTRRVRDAVIRLRPDVAHFHDPELMLIVPALSRAGIKVVFDIHEDTKTQILRKQYLHPLLRHFISRAYGLFESRICVGLSAMIVPQEAMVDEYARLGRVVVLPNYADKNVFPVRAVTFERPIILHAGGLSEDRGLLNMINAAGRITGDFEFYLAGPLASALQDVDMGSIKYLGMLPFDEVAKLYERCNTGVILYNNVGQYHMANAVKAFEYMANSMPIIMPDFGEWPEFNRKTKCGINVDPANAEQVAAAIKSLVADPARAADMGRNGRMAIEQEYSWQAVSPRLIELYKSI